MNAQETEKVGYSKALIALIAAVSCFLIYALACVLSPVTWSPDSSKIAILVTPPGDEPDNFAIFTYDIATGERVLLDSVEKNGALSAPAWSPDGKWIAYYRVDPSLSEKTMSSLKTDPNATMPRVEPTEKTRTEERASGSKKQIEATASGEKLFSEENRMLPPFLLDIVKEHIEEEEDSEFFDVKLIVVRPDGKERKILRILKWLGDEEDRTVLMFVMPAWSKDSKRLFYARALDEFFYISSLDIATGQTCAHIFSSLGTIAVSPDGDWVASLLKTDSKQFLLTLARVDGSSQKYLKLDPNIGEEELIDAFVELSWSPDSKHILIAPEEEFAIVDVQTGLIRKYRDPDTEKIAHGMFSPDRHKIYYLAVYEGADPNSDDERIFLKYVNQEDGKTQAVFEISELRGVEGVGKFSVSPDGRIMLLRCQRVYERSALIFWDGKTRKIVGTDRWLMKPLYSDEDLNFEEKLIGKWKGKDGEILVLEGVEEKIYRMTAIDEDGEKHHLAANLFKLKDMTFLGIFLDEFLLREKDSYGSHLLPDAFMKVEQIEPKLLLREMDYNELLEILSKDANSLGQAVMEAGEVIEFERISAEP